MYFKLFEEFNGDRVANILNKLDTDSKFLAYARKWSPLPDVAIQEPLDRLVLIEGLCGIVANYVRLHVPEATEMHTATDDNASGHAWIHYRDLHYDGLDTNGVKQWEDLQYFAEADFDEDEMIEFRKNLKEDKELVNPRFGIDHE